MNNNTTLKYSANFSAQGVAVAGTLIIGDKEVTFTQNIGNQFAADKGINPQASVQLPSDSVTYVGIEGRTLNTLDGGLRKRLRIDTADGGIYLFVIGKLEERVQEIRNLLGPDQLATTAPKPYIDPTTSDAYKDELDATSKVPKKRTLAKMFLMVLALTLVAPFLAIPFKSTALTLVLGLLMPLFIWMFIISYVGFRGSISTLQSIRRQNSSGQSGVNVDSSKAGVGSMAIYMHKTKTILKILGGVAVIMVVGAISCGIANGIIENI